MSESPRPASTPPTLASEDKEEREVEKNTTDLEVNEKVIRCCTLTGERALFLI